MCPVTDGGTDDGAGRTLADGATDSETCEWDGCSRTATTVTEWGDRYLCHGHELVASANADTHGEFGISADEYRYQIARAATWLEANPR